MHFLSKLTQKMRMYPLRTLGIIVGSCCLATAVFIVKYTITRNDFSGDQNIFIDLLRFLLPAHLIGLFFASPVVLSIYNILYLILPHSCGLMRKRSQRMELLTIIFGGLCFFLAAYIQIGDIRWSENWWEQLYNSALHAPVATWTYPTLITVAAIGLVGYLILYIARLRPLPPLWTALGLGGLYLGAGLALVLLIQLCKHDWILCLYLANLLLVAGKVIKELVMQYRESPSNDQKLSGIRRFLHNGQNLPLLGFLLAIPLLGIAVGILTLFGQAPDSIIQAWTQTSDWTLSQQVAPPNLPRDMHYLCTVAARGHQSLVKPLRMGKRHGHWVLVNRQLAVANAFEELIQERTPRLHRIIRGVYDRYGYPIANHIRSPWAADVVWLVMKPAEWFFLSILYLCDCKPENRIAVQYPHKELPLIDR